jgi:hypothetical protein
MWLIAELQDLETLLRRLKNGSRKASGCLGAGHGHRERVQ